MPDLVTELETRILRADTAISRALADAPSPEHLCLIDADLVRSTHAVAVAAGADLIRTNTLAANAASLAILGLGDHTNEINWMAVQLARQATAGSATRVAGRVGPLPDSVLPAERPALYRQQIGALLDARVDLICLEGFLDPEDLVSAIGIKHELHHLPVLASLATGDGLAVAVRNLRLAEADLISLDSLSLADTLTALAAVPGERWDAVFPRADHLTPQAQADITSSGPHLIGTN